MDLPPLSFIVLDTETTGLIPRVHRIIEFALVRVEDGKIVEEYEQLFSITEELPPVIQALTHIHPSDLQGKPLFADMREEIEGHIPHDALIMGQNISFDINMLKGEGIDRTESPWIDTSMLASLVYPELQSYSLGFMSSALSLHHEPVHRALGDVHATLELIEKIYQRLSEIPQDILHISQAIAAKSDVGYKRFFSHIPSSTQESMPSWLTSPSWRDGGISHTAFPITLQHPSPPTVNVMDEPLHPTFLQGVIEECAKDTTKTQWIAVKNLEATVRRLHIPNNVSILHPPFLLPDTEAVKRLASIPHFSSDEATLAMKLAWYEPDVHQDLPIHGNERAVWSGAVACTQDSPSYQEQFKDLSSTVLLDHRQLLSFLERPEDLTFGTLTSDTHILMDDASMLEDTATKAYGSYLSIQSFRAAAQGHTALTQFIDTLQLWIEKTRQFQDQLIFQDMHLRNPEARGLREQLGTISKSTSFPHQILRQLSHLEMILDPKRLKGNLTWIEVRQDGSQFLISSPESVSHILHERLFSHFPVTLFIPAESEKTLTEILPKETKRTQVSLLTENLHLNLPLSFETTKTIETVFEHPPAGKTIILMKSRRLIEQVFISFSDPLEKKGVTLFCQGLSGGQGRMQAEFCEAPSPAILVISPWIYEGLELPPETVDHLIVDALPFDSPAHPVFSKRSEHFNNAFEQYSLPRLNQRLFRMLRTFCFQRTQGSDATFTDSRLTEKSYGEHIMSYLKSLSAEKEREAPHPQKVPESPRVKAPVKTQVKKSSEPIEQLKLF